MPEGVAPAVTHRHGPDGRFHTHSLQEHAGPYGHDGEIVLGSGFEVAGVITVGYDGGNHTLKGEILRCRSCGTLLLPEDQSLHENLHDQLDRVLAFVAAEEAAGG
jgi:hypothetical protein